jgi:hypothetical protein
MYPTWFRSFALAMALTTYTHIDHVVAFLNLKPIMDFHFPRVVCVVPNHQPDTREDVVFDACMHVASRSTGRGCDVGVGYVSALKTYSFTSMLPTSPMSPANMTSTVPHIGL